MTTKRNGNEQKKFSTRKREKKTWHKNAVK